MKKNSNKEHKINRYSWPEKIMIMFGVLVVCNILDFGFYTGGMAQSSLVAINIIGLIVVAMAVQNIEVCLVFSFVSVMVYGYFFEEPRFTLYINKDLLANYILLFVLALIISVICVDMVTYREEKKQAEIIASREKTRANVLRGVSHDLRTPLTGILGNAALLTKSEQLDEETRIHLAENIADDASWLRDLVENMLALTKVRDVETYSIDLKLEYEIVSDLISDAIEHCDRNISKHELSVECEDVLIIKGDARLITQVLINIINNAVKYSGEGSHICVKAFERTYISGKTVVIRVEDDGPGVPESDKATIFDQFVVSGIKGGDSRRGMGLGLALCKEAVLLHKGTIKVLDNEPQGAVFEIEFPAVEIKEEE